MVKNGTYRTGDELDHAPAVVALRKQESSIFTLKALRRYTELQ